MPPMGEKVGKEDLPLRDRLSIDRTVMANERTYLAYIRTALTFLIAGVGLIKFFDSLIIEVIGWCFVLASIVVAHLGLRRYRAVRRTIEQMHAARLSESNRKGTIRQ